MNTSHDSFLEFETLIDSLINVHGVGEATISKKVDLLERLIEQWRIERHVLSYELEFEEFLVWKWQSDHSQLHFQKTNERVDYHAGTRPLRLQRNLLVFLLLHHREFEHVLDIIRAFVRTVRPGLSVRDFKKTETGVLRCFTNTRFAANKLRDYGLLKYTQTEAFKVWVLSLPGIVVAAKALKGNGWKLPQIADPWHGLDPFILDCAEATGEFSSLVNTLADLCEPNTQIFETFHHVLRESQQLLNRYWSTLQNSDLPTAARQAQSRQFVDQLESIIGYTAFIEELTISIQIEKLLADAATTAP
jgi:hypothetical protein